MNMKCIFVLVIFLGAAAKNRINSGVRASVAYICHVKSSLLMCKIAGGLGP